MKHAFSFTSNMPSRMASAKRSTCHPFSMPYGAKMNSRPWPAGSWT